MTPGLPNPGELEAGEEACEDGVGLDCGDWRGTPGSTLGAMAELERLA